MRAKGMSQADIARELQVSTASIGSDVQYLREQAKDRVTWTGFFNILVTHYFRLIFL
jgi:DNA-directed RNA polymerase specialized sigma24 family protein